MSNELQVQTNTVTPMDLLQVAMDKGADLDKLEKLMALQERYEANEARKEFNKAMAAFREECPTIARTREGHNNKFAGLAESIEQIKPIMSKHGLSHRWSTEQSDMITVTCTLTHLNGHSESTRLSAEPDKSGGKNSIQAIGSTVSYLERYTLYAILGLASREMDNDGNATVELINDDQYANIDALIDEVKVDRDKFFKAYRIESLEMLPSSMYDHACQALERKRK